MADKILIWLGSSRDDLRNFPDDARKQSGFQLRRIQIGLEPTDWRAMPLVGPGVIEIRIHTTGEYRIFYLAKFAEAVYVLHAFEKKTQRTPERDIRLVRRRYAELVANRKAKR